MKYYPAPLTIAGSTHAFSSAVRQRKGEYANTSWPGMRETHFVLAYKTRATAHAIHEGGGEVGAQWSTVGYSGTQSSSHRLAHNFAYSVCVWQADVRLCMCALHNLYVYREFMH